MFSIATEGMSWLQPTTDYTPYSHVSTWLKILAFIMHSKRPRLQRVGAPLHSSSASHAQPASFRSERLRLQSPSSASAAQPESFRRVMTDSDDEMAPEQMWSIRQCCTV